MTFDDATRKAEQLTAAGVPTDVRQHTGRAGGYTTRTKAALQVARDRYENSDRGQWVRGQYGLLRRIIVNARSRVGAARLKLEMLGVTPPPARVYEKRTRAEVRADLAAERVRFKRLEAAYEAARRPAKQ